MTQNYKFFLLFLILIPTFGFSQQCFEYHKQACIPLESKFQYDETTSSVSFLFKSGEVREIPVQLYKGKDYRITLCADEVFNGVISLKIAKADGNLLYDNSKFDYSLNIEFSSNKTQEVNFIVEAPEVISGDGSIIEGCIGLLIEDMVSVKTGF